MDFVIAHRVPRLWAIGLIAAVIPFGLALKYYRGPVLRWTLNNWGSSFAYELMFMLLAFVFFPRRRSATPIAITVCLATCGLEFLQLYKAPWLDSIRSTFIGGSLLGNAFSWRDLPAYPVSCFIGWFLLRWLARR